RRPSRAALRLRRSLRANGTSAADLDVGRLPAIRRDHSLPANPARPTGSGEAAPEGIRTGVLDAYVDELADHRRRPGQVHQPVFPVAAGEHRLSRARLGRARRARGHVVRMVMDARRRHGICENLRRQTQPALVAFEPDPLLALEQRVEAPSLLGGWDVVDETL